MDKHRLAITAAVVLGVAAEATASPAPRAAPARPRRRRPDDARPRRPRRAPAAHRGATSAATRRCSPATRLAKVTAIAKAKVAGGTIIRVETDADGNAAYEAHMTKADGSPVTVYVDKDFNFVSIETGGPGGHGGPGHQRSDETVLTGDTLRRR